MNVYERWRIVSRLLCGGSMLPSRGALMAEIAGEAWQPEYERARCEAFAIVASAIIESIGLEAAA